MSFGSITLQLLSGFGNTCLIFIITLICAAPLGLLVAFGSMSRLAPFAFLARKPQPSSFMLRLAAFRPIRAITRLFVWVIRGTPLMLQVMVVFYVPGLLWDMPFKNRILAVLIAFVINYSAYFSEIYRSGIESIPKGQYEACQVQGMTKSQIFFKVVLLQVVKRIIPPMSNEIVTLVKDTSLARVIAAREIIMEANSFVTVNGLVWPLFYSGVFYLLFNGILQIVFDRIEKKLDYFKV